METRKVVKQVVGIDIGMESFYACYKIKLQDANEIIKGTKSFENTVPGRKSFYLWCEKRNKTPDCPPIYVMEATGVYYEDLAYYLYEKEQKVSVQLAQKLKYYAKSHNLKTKTDKVDSKMIATFGIEKTLTGTELWAPPSKEFKVIRDLAREHTRLKQAASAAKSQLHAFNHAHKTYKKVIALKKRMVSFYEKQLNEIETEIEKQIKADEKLHIRIKNIEAVKGLGFITIVKVLAEVNGFLLFKNIGQLVSYAGLDVVEKESGKYKGKTKISKKGNARIRAALYMPAMTATRHNKTLKAFYERVNEGRTIKKQGLIAVMRKLLILIYTLWKKEESYIENYKVC
ncbi:MAG: IS110 family transposase [Flavobacteriaceae bacterium]